MATPLAQAAPLPAVLPRHDGRYRALARTALRWIGLSLAGCLLLATWRHAQIGQAFAVDARARHAVLAQRMDQHDAHLTSLAAVAQLDDPDYASFKAVASAVRKYYPRVVDIDLVRLGAVPQVLATTDGGADLPIAPEALRTLAQSLSAGKAGVLAAGDGERYALVKRLGGDTLSVLVLSIDVARLVAMDGDDDRPPSMVLTDTAGTVVGHAHPASRDGARSWPPTLRLDEDLASASQPLHLTVTRRLSLDEVLPVPQVLLVLLASAALWWLAGTLARARQARREAALRTQELRLVHAMRVNGLGEMASGIAHELTQPMTAVLSQSQAGLRLIGQGASTDALVPVLEANVKLARRAGDILARMRSYASQRAPATQAVILDDLVADALALARADLAARGVALSIDRGAPDATVHVDPVSIEQVLHNLLRNAAEALADGPPGAGRIAVATGVDADGAYVSVTDNGPGIAPPDLARLFTPFFTTKSDGMGLGLSICARLIDAGGGRIDVDAAPGGGARFTVHLPVAPRTP